MNNKVIITCLFALAASASAHSGHGVGPHVHNHNGESFSLLALTACLSLCAFTAHKLIKKTKKTEV